MPDRKRIHQERRAVRRRFIKLHHDLSTALFRDDPIGINDVTNTDEYALEVGTILPRLKDCRSVSDVIHVVHEEFTHWFGAEDAGPASRYVSVASEIWKLWSEFDSDRRLGKSENCVYAKIAETTTPFRVKSFPQVLSRTEPLP